MLKIAVYDTDEVFSEELKMRIEECLKPWGKEEQVTVLVKTFNNIFQLFDVLTQQFQIFFLDITMSYEDGKRLAFHIKEMDKNAYIIFMSRKKEYVLEAFELGVSAYLMKPVNYEILKKELERAKNRVQSQIKDAIIVKIKGNYHKIYLSDIQYIETDGIYTKLHTENGIVESRKRMKEYESILETKSFVRCHNSYIVNLDYIKEIEKSKIILETGENLFISKAKRKITRDRFIEHIGTMI